MRRIRQFQHWPSVGQLNGDIEGASCIDLLARENNSSAKLLDVAAAPWLRVENRDIYTRTSRGACRKVDG
eukprot:9136932-Alexandrium_andersonii.AAC.1